MANFVNVPKPASTAYNPDRPLEKNKLIKAQVEHFKHVDDKLPPEFQTGVDIATVTTEGRAGEYIRLVTRAIHESGGREARKVERA